MYIYWLIYRYPCFNETTEKLHYIKLKFINFIHENYNNDSLKFILNDNRKLLIKWTKNNTVPVFYICNDVYYVYLAYAGEISGKNISSKYL